MKKYLENLCDELDVAFTHFLEERDDWRELVIEILLNNILEFQNNTRGDIDLLLKDMKNASASKERKLY